MAGYQQARAIADKSRRWTREEGEEIVRLLLENRELAKLNIDELHLLGRGYNWWGRHEESFEVWKLAVERDPSSAILLECLRCGALNITRDYIGMLDLCSRMIDEGIGPAAYWNLQKAAIYISYATGEYELEDYEWHEGEPILHPEYLEKAVDEISQALRIQPGLREQPWAGNWKERFNALNSVPAYRQLAGIVHD